MVLGYNSLINSVKTIIINFLKNTWRDILTNEQILDEFAIPFPETETGFREYIDELDLNDISHTRMFSIDFMREFKDYIDFNSVLEHKAGDDDIPIKFWKEMGLEVIGNIVIYTDYFGVQHGYGIWNREGLEIARRGSLN